MRSGLRRLYSRAWIERRSRRRLRLRDIHHRRVNRYPRRGTISTYWGVLASSFNASRIRFTALFNE
jgi:hypothetical protein